jgi:hypothetical protein
MKRTIKTVYYGHAHDSLRVTRGTDANRAVANCVLHMQVNHYGAHAAEVYDDETGELHAAIKRSVSGKLTIVYQRDPVKYETQITIKGSIALGYMIGV